MKNQLRKEKGSRLFHGKLVTPGNRHQVYHNLVEYFINNISKEERYEGFDNDQILAAGRGYAMYEIGRENKHHKAFLKGKPSYTHKGKRFPVIVSEIGEVFASDTEAIKELIESK